MYQEVKAHMPPRIKFEKLNGVQIFFFETVDRKRGLFVPNPFCLRAWLKVLKYICSTGTLTTAADLDGPGASELVASCALGMAWSALPLGNQLSQPGCGRMWSVVYVSEEVSVLSSLAAATAQQHTLQHQHVRSIATAKAAVPSTEPRTMGRTLPASPLDTEKYKATLNMLNNYEIRKANSIS